MLRSRSEYDTLTRQQEKAIVEKVKQWFYQQMDLGSDRIVKYSDWLIGPSQNATEVPEWHHPITIEYNKRHYTLVDARPFMNQHGEIRNGMEFRNLQKRAVLSNVWHVQPEDFDSLDSVLPIVFAKWVTSAIQMRHGIDLRDQQITEIVMAAYYQTLMRDANRLSKESAYVRVSRFIGEKMRLRNPLVEGLLADETFKEFVDGLNYAVLSGAGMSHALKYTGKLIQSQDIEVTHSELLIQLVGRSWSGLHAQEIAAIAMEHPPTLAYMVLNTIESSFYRKTRLGSAVKTARQLGVNANEVSRVFGQMEKELG